MDKKFNNVSSSKYKTCVPDIFFLRPHSYRHPDNNAHYGIVLLVSVLTRVHCTVIGMSCQLLILTSMYMWQKFTNNRRSHIMINLYLRYNDVYECQLADVKNMKRNLVSLHFFYLYIEKVLF